MRSVDEIGVPQGRLAVQDEVKGFAGGKSEVLVGRSEGKADAEGAGDGRAPRLGGRSVVYAAEPTFATIELSRRSGRRRLPARYRAVR